VQGVVGKYFREKSFGFIQTEAGDFFFHAREVVGDIKLRVGDQVEFWLDDDLRNSGKLRAVEVRVIPGTS
jgi:cold shock CspA family protein